MPTSVNMWSERVAPVPSGASNGWWATRTFTTSVGRARTDDSTRRNVWSSTRPLFHWPGRVVLMPVIEADDHQVAVGPDRLEVGGNDAPVAAERVEGSCDHVEQRHVVVTRHDEARRRQPVDEGASLAELRPAGALSEIAGDRDNVRRQRPDGIVQGTDHARIGAPEVQV